MFKWIRNLTKKRPDATITDEQRQHSLETRRMQWQIQNLEKKLQLKEQLNTLSEGIGGSKEDKIIEMFLPVLLSSLMGQRNNSTVPPTLNNADSYTGITDPQKNQAIAELVKKHVPSQYLEQVKALSDKDLADIKMRL